MRALVLLSSGIDSPVAAALVARSGTGVDLLHMDNRPFSDDEGRDKAIRLAKHIAGMIPGPTRLIVAPHGESAQREIGRHCETRLQCVLCRRFMYRTACAIGREQGHTAIVTGENLGQVASQTLDNLRAESPAADLPVLRPLIGWDKMEIVAAATELGTFEISVEPSLCCLLAPEKPSIRATLATVLKEEEKLDVEGIVRRSIEGIEIIEL